MDISKNILDLRKTNIEPIAKDEIFVQVHNTINYWISNHGRLVNNLRKNFYLHKTGDVHWTIQAYYIGGAKCPRDTSPSELVAEHFLEPVKGKNRIYNIDGNKANNYYKNIIYVDNQEYYDLSIGKININDLGRQQEYMPYITARKNRAYLIYNAIYKRCYDTEYKRYHQHYKEATMYEGWRNDPELFIEWYESNYYECDDENMQVDKDLLFPGNKEYHPLKCCILPQKINNILSNSKKHYTRDTSILTRKINKELPIGVRYDNAREKYYGQITMDGKTITLSYWSTPEEAFKEYKKHKQAYILIIADMYKGKIPKKYYDAMVRFTVEPY